MEEDTDDDLLDYEPSTMCDGMEISVIYVSSTYYYLLEEEEVSQLALGHKTPSSRSRRNQEII
jgi:hypothetical protein